jgi:hypothetical protein
MPRRTAFVLGITCSLFALGCYSCDPVRTTRQTFSVRVVDSDSGSPIAGAQVQWKSDFDRREAMLPEAQRLSEEWHQHLRESWDREPWTSCITDAYGQAVATEERQGLDRTSGEKPPTARDITGRPYLFKVNAAQEPEEVLSVLMKRGESVRGKRLTVTVIEVHEPVYIDTRSRP